MKKYYKKFKIKKLVDEQNVKKEGEHEPKNAAENKNEFKFIEERIRN